MMGAAAFEHPFVIGVRPRRTLADRFVRTIEDGRGPRRCPPGSHPDGGAGVGAEAGLNDPLLGPTKPPRCARDG